MWLTVSQIFEVSDPSTARRCRKKLLFLLEEERIRYGQVLK